MLLKVHPLLIKQRPANAAHNYMINAVDSVDGAQKVIIYEQLHSFRKKTSSIGRHAGLQEHVVLRAKRDQSEVGGLQKQDRPSFVSFL